MMKYFYSDGSGIFKFESVPIHKAREPTELFECKNNNAKQRTDLRPAEQLWEILFFC